jgi:large subunit ribosomal protein L9
MKVLLKEKVDKLGNAGDVVTVANGFARNYLLPRQLAVPATPGQLRQVDLVRRQAQSKSEKLAAQHAALARRLSGIVLTFEASAGEKGRLYGSITPDQIAEALESRIGEPVDRRKIQAEPLRQIGAHAIPFRINAELIPEVTAIVHREGEDPLSYLPTEPEPEVEAEAETSVEATTEIDNEA